MANNLTYSELEDACFDLTVGSGNLKMSNIKILASNTGGIYLYSYTGDINLSYI